MVYGLLTVLNIKDMGFFLPHRYAAGLERNKNKTCWIHKWFSEDKIDAFSDTLETVSAFLAVLIINSIAADGKSNWLEGAMLLSSYCVLGAAFLFHP